MYVTEDLPEEWIDRRKVLKPIFNTAKRMQNLKEKTHLSKGKLYIDGKMYSAGPENNVHEANEKLNITDTCQRSDENTIIFLGSHSPQAISSHQVLW